jgi:hypothetical protein
MDARIYRAALVAALTLCAASTQAGSYRTKNFVVSAPTPAMATQIGQAAEQYRRELAIDWLGKELPTWAQPCPISAQVAPNLGAGGATSFLFEHGEVYGWQMTIQGSLERILDSVLPHEVTHTIFATHFRRPLPRWADEGACTTVEHASERAKQQMMLVDFLRTGRGIPFSSMFAMRDYPSDVMPLYSQGYSLARFLIAHGGKHKFLQFVGDGLRSEQWQRTVEQHYGFTDLGQLQNAWLEWVRQGSPPLDRKPDSLDAKPDLVASNDRTPAPKTQLVRNASVEAYPTDEQMPLVPVRLNRTNSAKSTKVKPQTASWQPRSSAFVVPEDSAQPTDSVGPERYPADDTTDDLATADTGSYQMTRPQPPERARQVILEWSRTN